ncbi:vacuolar protein 14-like protein [Nitzschia inconspicua]|uniref:Vacuolar protein 14-like protein n=1 Tax=Nitzschia inconspicua TaxID=303405 RepID=A0A9K3L890_9STRA|nr:vacuolar protein 14-like protein [Nitzschia inconspicua]
MSRNISTNNTNQPRSTLSELSRSNDTSDGGGGGGDNGDNSSSNDTGYNYYGGRNNNNNNNKHHSSADGTSTTDASVDDFLGVSPVHRDRNGKNGNHNHNHNNSSIVKESFPRHRTHPVRMQQQQQQQQQQLQQPTRQRTVGGPERGGGNKGRHDRKPNGKPNHLRRNDDAFSSSSSSTDDDDDDEEEEEDDEEDDDEDSSDTGEDDDDDDDEDDSFSHDEGSSENRQSHHHHGRKHTKNSYGSEFDKAMRSGQGPSRGNFFGERPETPPSNSTKALSRGGGGGNTGGRGGNTTPPPPPQGTKGNGSSATTNVHVITKDAAASSTTSSQQQQQQQQMNQVQQQQSQLPPHPEPAELEDPLSSGVLPDVLMTMRQKIESLTLFDSDMMKLASGGVGNDADNILMDDPIYQETRESLKRSSQQSISAAVLVSLAHKRYERRRLAAMEIEKVVRSLVQQDELERVRAILLLLSDDYVRSTSEDARKGGVVALAASAIGLKKAPDTNPIAHECRDLILASVVHACQDHSQRVRYYATESLFNVIKVIPNLAVQHFFILFEILRSLFADVDLDVKSGAEMLDKKLKEIIVGAMNSGQFSAEACVPVFARFVYMRNKATKRLTLTWLQELTEKLIGAPILEFLHLFLTGIFDMIADPTLAIRQSALAFLQSVLPKLLDNHVVEEAIDDFQTAGIKVDFDKILQSLVFSMEHPDPMVRKIAMYWMSRIVKAHISGDNQKKQDRITTNDTSSKSRSHDDDLFHGLEDEGIIKTNAENQTLSAATISVRNALPHILPGVLLSIGDTFQSKPNNKDSFLPDVTTHTLAEQTNVCLQGAVRKDGKAYVNHLDSFIVALREELDSPGGVNARNPPAVERKPYRMDVKHDGTGIESQGWFRKSNDTKETNTDSMMWSRLCALQWIVVLYESVVPDVLKADYAREFIIPIIHQLVDNPPERIIFKSLEVLAKITVPVQGELPSRGVKRANSLSGLAPSSPSWILPNASGRIASTDLMKEESIEFALDILDTDRRELQSRDREVFSALIQLYGCNLHLIGDLSRVIAHMCRLQPPEFVFVSFSVELDNFIRRERNTNSKQKSSLKMSRDFQFVSTFIQQMCLVLLNSRETKDLRVVLKDCIGHGKEAEERDRKRTRLFHILLHSFAHNLLAATSLCLWGCACRTASLFLKHIDPMDINLVFLLELDKLVEMIERPLFRHLHVRMLDTDKDPLSEGSGTMLFQTLKCILMLLPQSASYNVLRDRLVSTSRFRQSVICNSSHDDEENLCVETEAFVSRVLEVRSMHCHAMWETIRTESLESMSHLPTVRPDDVVHSMHEEGTDRREWLGFSSKEEEMEAKAKYKAEKIQQSSGVIIEDVNGGYNDISSMPAQEVKSFTPNTDGGAITFNRSETGLDDSETKAAEDDWKNYWSTGEF